MTSVLPPTGTSAAAGFPVGIIKPMNPAIFLDRDGVIIENCPDYVRSWGDVAIYPDALAALEKIYRSPFKIVLVTNQSAVGRGIISLDQVHQINERLLTIIQNSGGRVDAVYVCPHAPNDHCSCRKPKPGLLLQAADELALDLSHSILIGDALSDLQAGQAAGIPTRILLQTGRGSAQMHLPAAAALQPFPVFASLSAALDSLLEILLP